MTKFKVYRVNGMGQVQVEILEASDWVNLLSMHQYSGAAIFKIEVYSGPDHLGV